MAKFAIFWKAVGKQKVLFILSEIMQLWICVCSLAAPGLNKPAVREKVSP
jgi:hypothetical protein